MAENRDGIEKIHYAIEKESKFRDIVKELEKDVRDLVSFNAPLHLILE